VDPFAGEGIALALRGAAMLSDLLTGALREAGRPGTDLEHAWRRRWRRAFLPRMRLCRLLGLLAPRPAILEPVVALLSRREGLAGALVAATRPAT
jgi:flavin-dependent dehydrogenase